MSTFQRRASAPTSRSASTGFTLVELMIGMVLGLFMIGASLSFLLSFNRTYASVEDMSRVSESARVAFELMTRELRELGGNPCSRYLPVANVLNSAGSAWWNTWGQGIVGYENGALAGSLSGTDAFQLLSSASSTAVVTNHDSDNAMLVVVPQRHGFSAGDILMACDYRQAAIFQMTGPAGSPVSSGQIEHQMGAGAPGNCTDTLGFKNPIACGASTAKYRFPDNSTVIRLQASRWYVAPNERGGNSLFRIVLRNGEVAAPEEVVEGVDDMQVAYLLPGSTEYVDATAVPSGRWREVLSVRIALLLKGRVAVGADGARVKRQLQHTVAIRNRHS